MMDKKIKNIVSNLTEQVVGKLKEQGGTDNSPPVSSNTDLPYLKLTQVKNGYILELNSDKPSEPIETEVIEIENTSDPEAVINIQGDEPFIQPEQIDLVAACFQDKNVELATLVKVIDNELVLNDPNTPKVVLDSESNAIYFSRQAIPYLRDVPESDWLKSHIFYKHIGIYGYLTDSLKKITQLKPSILERAEALEQLRWLENGYRVRVKETQFESEGIDTPEQLQEIISRLVKG